MKKIIALLMSLCMLLSCATVVGAAGETETETTYLHTSDEVDATLEVIGWEGVRNSIYENAAFSYGLNTAKKLTDKNVSPKDTADPGNTWNVLYNWLLVNENKDSLTITLKSEDVIDNFGGLRFYSRKTNSSTSTAVNSWENVGKAQVSVSTDGTNWATLDNATAAYGTAEGFDTDRWTSFSLKSNGTEVAVSGAKYIKIVVSKTYGGGSIFGCEEIRLLQPGADVAAQTVENIAKTSFTQNLAGIESYAVHGGLEWQKYVSLAESAYNAMSASDKDEVADDYATFVGYKDKLEAATVKEINGRLQATENKAWAKNGEERVNYGVNLMHNGEISKSNIRQEPGTYMQRGDWAFEAKSDGTAGQKLAPSHVLIKMDIDPTAEFSGIRFYTRRADGNRSKSDPVNNYQHISLPKNVEITLYGEDDKKLDTISLTGVNAVKDTDFTGTDNSPYADFRVAAEGKGITGVTKAEVRINSLNGGSHFGCEEIRLTSTDGDVTESFGTVLAASTVGVINKIEEYPVYGGLERKALIDQADSMLAKLTDEEKATIQDDIDKLTELKTKYNGTVQEIDSDIAVTENKAYAADGTVRCYYGVGKLTDGHVNKSSVLGTYTTIEPGNWAFVAKSDGTAVEQLAPSHMIIKITGDEAAEFTGIRFYSGKEDGKDWYLSGYMPKTTEITITNSDNETISMNVNGAVCKLDTDSDKKNVYADLLLTDGSYSLTGIKSIEIKITGLVDGGQHFRSEEIRLVKHGAGGPI